jgi:DNA mismatch repair protein MutL
VPVPRIKVLADSLVNRIAAGEVVERPASVVKELLENSLDAEAERIEVELVAGGRSLIRVRDDGCGMDQDDALLALERHATSKISTVEDLDHISSLGFRGEALPSMAAVSRFQLHTSADPAEGGVRVTVEGGRILGVEPAARARGTTVEVRDLFYNTPARRKFLRAPETELRHIQETIWAAALANPEAAFVLRHGSRTLIEAVPTADPGQRLRDLWRRIKGPVHRFDASGGGVEVWGLLAPGTGSGRPSLTLIVNGRAVRDRLLVGAVRRVLSQAGGGLGGSRVVLFVTVPPDSVDVNVHPAKAEVRFVRGGSVFGVVERAVRDGVAASRGHVGVRRIETAHWVAEADGGTFAPASAPPPGGSLFSHPVYGDGSLPDETALPSGAAATDHPSRGPGPKAGVPDTPFGRLIGYYRSSFLLLEDEWGLVIVDQHVAHERVLYDRIKARLADATAPSQRLLEPILLELDEASVAALGRVQEVLAAVGIEADGFGHGAIRIAAVPPDTDPGDAAEVVEELLDRANALDGVPDGVPDELAHELAASLSCRAAVKVNDRLTEPEQRVLLNDLIRTENPYRCPHGRPIVLRLSQEEMERRLGRR